MKITYFLINFLITSLSVMVGLSFSKLARPTIPAIAHYFGTKGRYEEVNPHLLDDILFVNRSLLVPPSPDYRAIHMVSVIRHGTRYPTTKNVQKIARLFDLVVSDASGSESWLNNIKTWKMWYTEDMDGRLVDKGRDDHRHLAMRLAQSFPTLISEDLLRANRIEFITSSKHRCIDSVKAFQEGLHRLWDVQDMDYKHYVDDSLMRFFDHCERFVEGVENNKTALKEVERFKYSAEMDAVRKKISNRLQIPFNQITPDMAEAAFFLCSYEFAIKSENSPWCDLLDESDAQVLEYKNDLKQYWKRGYGHDINRKSSCPLFHDIFKRLDKAANDYKFGEVKETATIQVGHGETLLPLLSLLAFFKDEKPLTAENFSSQHNRMFRSSQIVPYAANLVFVLYECSDGLRVQLFLNEKPMTFPSMNHSAPLYETVRKHYSKLLRGCDFNKECDVPQPNLRNTEL
ncbi:multiple inositol polyphosphate phosphatase 1b [Rhinichthys klamathensis goyatoka]|uniref:multiple inositol polyphosphate phosphatase 1b n=1 Tax=Rhinichthys klamathensis goyatoka TaxID=3034132 RepID=UPI0024B5F0D6|nr:multiple inositol polyphosphate phosphatase 1b [Rhinichthys klamathensis goyatoka]